MYQVKDRGGERNKEEKRRVCFTEPYQLLSLTMLTTQQNYLYLQTKLMYNE